MAVGSASMALLAVVVWLVGLLKALAEVELMLLLLLVVVGLVFGGVGCGCGTGGNAGTAGSSVAVGEKSNGSAQFGSNLESHS